MCAVMGGLMVIMNRIKKKNEVAKVKVNPPQQLVDQQFVETKHSLSEHSQNVHEKTLIEKVLQSRQGRR